VCLLKMCKKAGFTALLSGMMLVAVGCGTQGTSGNLGTSSTSSNFPNRTVTLIVPFAPGGDFDTSSRVLATYLSKYLPNQPTVIVKNIPGGNTTIGLNTVFNAKPDGYTLVTADLPGAVLGPMLGQANYNLTKLDWIGQVFDQPYVAAVSKKSGITDLKSLQAHSNLLVGTTGITTTAGLGAFVTMHELGVSTKTIPSAGSTPSVLAAAQGAVDFVQFPYNAMRQEIQSGLLTPLWVDAAARLSVLPNVPTIGELGYPKLANVVSLISAIGTTPGTPASRVAILQAAFQKAMNDPGFIAKMNSDHLKPVYLSGTDTEAVVQTDLSVMQKYVPQIKAAVGK